MQKLFLGLSIVLFLISNACAAWSASIDVSNTADDSYYPVMAVDSSTAYIAWEEHTPGNAEIFYSNSTDGGATWSTPVNVSSNSGDSWVPTIAVDSGTIYLAWTDFTPGNWEVFYSNSTDGGATWSAPVNVSENAGTSFRPSMALDSGAIRLAWFDDAPGNAEIFYSNSTDGGATWSAPVNVSNTAAASNNPSIAVAAGAIHIVWADDTPGSREIFYSNSVDGGATWSTPINLSNNPSWSADPVMAVNSSAIHVAWWDDAPGTGDIFHLNSTDGGVTWNTRSDVSNNGAPSSGPAIAVDPDTVHIVWMDNTLGNFEIFYSKSIPDILPPSVSTVWLTEATQNDSTEFWVTATDNMAVTQCDFYWNSVNVSSMMLADVASGTWAVNYTPTELGNFSASVNCSDAAGNSNKTDTTISVNVGPRTLWYRLWGINSEYGEAVTTDSSGNVYVAGYTQSFGASGALLVKYDSSGNQLWNATFGQTGDTGYGVKTDPLGNVYMAGSTTIFGLGSTDAFLVKYDSSGTELWNRSWGGADSDVANSIAFDSLGNVYLAGSAKSFSVGGDIDVFLVKYDPSGNQQWNRTWGGADGDFQYGLAINPSGDIYISGITASFGAGGGDVLILKYNGSGDYQWNATWGGAGDDGSRSLVLDSTGNVYIVGYTGSFGAGNLDVLLAKYDPSGTQLWNTTFGWASWEYGAGLALDASGNVYVAGATVGFGGSAEVVLLLKFNSSGSQQWYRIWSSIIGAHSRAMAIDSSGDIYLTGYMFNFDWSNILFLAKFRESAPSGNVTGAASVTYAAPELNGLAILVLFLIAAAVMLAKQK
jgi:hypothetical protein